MVNRRWALAILLGILVGLAGCAGRAPAEAAGPWRLTIVHSNDTQGLLEPCG